MKEISKHGSISKASLKAGMDVKTGSFSLILMRVLPYDLGTVVEKNIIEYKNFLEKIIKIVDRWMNTPRGKPHKR